MDKAFVVVKWFLSEYITYTYDYFSGLQEILDFWGIIFRHWLSFGVTKFTSRTFYRFKRYICPAAHLHQANSATSSPLGFCGNGNWLILNFSWIPVQKYVEYVCILTIPACYTCISSMGFVQNYVSCCHTVDQWSCNLSIWLQTDLWEWLWIWSKVRVFVHSLANVNIQVSWELPPHTFLLVIMSSTWKLICNPQRWLETISSAIIFSMLLPWRSWSRCKNCKYYEFKIPIEHSWHVLFSLVRLCAWLQRGLLCTCDNFMINMHVHTDLWGVQH